MLAYLLYIHGACTRNTPKSPEMIPQSMKTNNAGNQCSHHHRHHSAQKLLFQHTDAEVSDMTKYFSGYFDTVSAGPKTEAASYKIIAEKTGINAASWLFLSDNVKGLLPISSFPPINHQS